MTRHTQLLIALFVIFVIAACRCRADEPARNEAYYTEHFAQKYNAETEAAMGDGTRCDLLSETHAIEVDWSAKHYEAVGQAIHYHLQTGRKPGVLLLVKDPASEWRHLVRCARTCGHLGIDFYVEVVKP